MYSKRHLAGVDHTSLDVIVPTAENRGTTSSSRNRCHRGNEGKVRSRNVLVGESSDDHGMWCHERKARMRRKTWHSPDVRKLEKAWRSVPGEVHAAEGTEGADRPDAPE